VQVHYGEGVANRIGPEPCVGTREGGGEASVGERIGQPLSRVSKIVPSADVVEITEGNTDGCEIASARPARRGRRPWHVRKLLAREPGDLGFGQRRNAAGPHREDEESKPMMHEREKSDSAIVATMPANNAGRPAAERVERRAGTMGNAGQQSTRRAQNRDSVTRRWTVCAKPRRSTAWRQIPLVRAGCLNWACPDLCGGRSAMAVPTAKDDRHPSTVGFRIR